MDVSVSCFSKIQIGFTFLVPAHPGSPGKRAVKRVCVCAFQSEAYMTFTAHANFFISQLNYLASYASFFFSFHCLIKFL